MRVARSTCQRPSMPDLEQSLSRPQSGRHERVGYGSTSCRVCGTLAFTRSSISRRHYSAMTSAEPRRDREAEGALMLAALGLLAVPIVPSVCAVVMGFKAKRRIDQDEALT